MIFIAVFHAFQLQFQYPVPMVYSKMAKRVTLVAATCIDTLRPLGACLLLECSICWSLTAADAQYRRMAAVTWLRSSIVKFRTEAGGVVSVESVSPCC